MTAILTAWKPSKKNLTFQEKPEWVPETLYTQALAIKRTYNESWDVWVHNVANQHNCSIADAEDACIRGIQKDIYRQKLIYGPKIGQWYEEFLGMGDLFRKVSHPIYLPKLG